MAFTLRTTDKDEQAIATAQKFVDSKKKGEILLECARLVPILKGDIRNLEKEVYRLQRIEKEFNSVKEMFKNLVS
ncbi:hypothetical protein ACOW85_001642 [Vibrio parahaemolyticus]|nr:hypothetical protein [Vibrio parahaemolyticus]